MIRSLLSTSAASASQQTLKTIKMSDIEELAASKVYNIVIIYLYYCNTVNITPAKICESLEIVFSLI